MSERGERDVRKVGKNKGKKAREKKKRRRLAHSHSTLASLVLRYYILRGGNTK